VWRTAVLWPRPLPVALLTANSPSGPAVRPRVPPPCKHCGHVARQPSRALGLRAEQGHWRACRRGVYRASTRQWFHPEEMVPNGSHKDPVTGTVRTPMASGPQQWQVRLEVPKKLAPLHFGWSLLHQGQRQALLTPRCI
jgi:hypothetical protein